MKPYLLLSLVLVAVPVSAQTTQQNGNSTMQNIFNGLAAVNPPPVGYPDAFGPYGYRGPTWENFSQAYQPPPPQIQQPPQFLPVPLPPPPIQQQRR